MKPHNLSNRFRRARMDRFLSLLDLTRPMRILDIGGTADYWRALPPLYGLANVEISVVNLGHEERDEANLRIRHGNACKLHFADMSFDVVHSNSVIEHVGRWPEMQAMAGEVRRLAPIYFVQTPNFWFPIEPHFKLPLVHFLPERARAIAIGALRPRSFDIRKCHEIVRRTRLLSRRKMETLFPDAAIESEKFGGLSKSLTAVRAFLSNSPS